MTENKIYYVSPEGLAALEGELKERSTTLRKQISETIGVAKDQGDLSENFEYQDAKERQGANETRIIKLRDMLTRVKLIEKSSGDDVQLGSSFVVKLADGGEKNFEIVGATETDPIAGKISNESPIGKAFIGQKPGASVDVETPSGTINYIIKSID
jgi:transcription elongation factor GreA